MLRLDIGKMFIVRIDLPRKESGSKIQWEARQLSTLVLSRPFLVL